MTNIETILKMLEDPESDKDELNARIWCWRYGKDFHSVARVSNSIHVNWHPENKDDCGWSNLYYNNNDYVNSLDAAMSIGAEELEGWYIRNLHCADNKIHACEFVHKTAGGVTSVSLPDIFSAICHARLQALDYVRGKN